MDEGVALLPEDELPGLKKELVCFDSMKNYSVAVSTMRLLGRHRARGKDDAITDGQTYLARSSAFLSPSSF